MSDIFDQWDAFGYFVFKKILEDWPYFDMRSIEKMSCIIDTPEDVTPEKCFPNEMFSILKSYFVEHPDISVDYLLKKIPELKQSFEEDEKLGVRFFLNLGLDSRKIYIDFDYDFEIAFKNFKKLVNDEIKYMEYIEDIVRKSGCSVAEYEVIRTFSPDWFKIAEREVFGKFLESKVNSYMKNETIKKEQQVLDDVIRGVFNFFVWGDRLSIKEYKKYVSQMKTN